MAVNSSVNRRAENMISRCKDVRDMIYNGATTEKLERHFHVSVRALMASMLKHHYTTTIGKERYFPNLKKRLAMNDEMAAAKKNPSNQPNAPVDTEPSTSQQPETTEPTVRTEEPKQPTKTIYMVETGSVLSLGVDHLLNMDNGEAVFYIPRLCINELEKKAHFYPKVQSEFAKIYGENVFKKRFFPVSAASESFSRTLNPDDSFAYKMRTHDIVDTALEMALDLCPEDNISVTVITASREINNLLSSIIRAENLQGLMKCFFVRPRHYNNQVS